MAVGRIITGPDCVAEGAAWLAAREPRFAHALSLTGPLPLRRREDGFRALLSAIVSQQVSVASANAIWARLEAADEEVVAVLTAVPGIGRWTAEIYAMFALGRADVFAPADLALQEGVRLLFSLEARPQERALRAMAEAWSPWRAVAARLLWAYYHVEKRREGIR